jgi:hypothetical protein
VPVLKSDKLFKAYEDETERQRGAIHPRAWMREKAKTRALARKQTKADLLAYEKRQAALAGQWGQERLAALKEAAKKRLVVRPSDEKLEAMRRGFKG